MSYTKQTWVTGDTITAEKLNHIEDGVADSGSVFNINVTEEGTTWTMNKTWNEIKNAFLSGKMLVVSLPNGIDEKYTTVVEIRTQVNDSQYYVDTASSNYFCALSADGYPEENAD